MTIAKDYLTFTKKWKSQYGDKTIVLIQVGAFFEVYALLGENGSYIGSDIKNFASINDMAIANKHNSMLDDNGVKRDIVIAGFGLPQIEKYVNRLQKNGYTIVIYTQDIPAKNSPRSLSEIISPGTFFTSETTQLTNHVMCIWVDKSNARKQHNEQLTLGIAVIDILTGYVSSSQFNRDFYHTPCTYDELDRMVSIYNPSECIIISNLSRRIIDEIVIFSGIMSKKLHIISDLYESDVVASTTDFRIYAQNAEKQIYQVATLEKFYPAIPNDEIIEMFPTHWIALQSLTFLLNFVYQHSPNLVNKLQQPVFENNSEKLILANHSLKQLNILSDNKHTGKLSSVSSFLNNCVTVMGKREFTRILHNPTTNVDWLNKSYAITEYALKNNIWETSRGHLSGVNDIEKFSRKLVLKKVSPKELYVFYNDISKLLVLYNEIKTDETVNTYINQSVKLNGTSVSAEYINVACNSILNNINKKFNIERCSHIYNLNGELLSSITTPTEFFIKQGVSLEIDQLFDDCIHSRKKLEAIRVWLSERIATIEKIHKSAKSKSKSKSNSKLKLLSSITTNQSSIGTGDNTALHTAQNTAKTTSFIKIHDTPKSEPILVGTNRRIELLKSAMDSISKTEKGAKTVCLQYKDCRGIDAEFEFSYDKLEYFNIGSNKKDRGVTNKTISDLSHKTQQSENNLVLETINFFNLFIADFAQFHDTLHSIVQFTTAVDILQAKCYIADKYNYNKPEIATSEKAFFSIKGIRHPLIEHIQTNELYITNDICLGKSSYHDGCSDEHLYNGMLLYGTNAVGKTSLIKSIGIAIIMAQSGLYVPCKSFCFSPYQSIYTRILGNDNIFKGLSTFAVEMTELRTILCMADKNSLILGDELCSGTESDSALSIFTAGLEHLHETGATHLFATHFHEIQRFEEITALRKLCMKHMAVTYDEKEDSLVYDRKLRDGSGDSMYGLEVCKSLHLPDEFLKRAHYLRTKYNDSQQNILSQKTSHFNAKKIKGTCEMCKVKGTEVHHLQHQHEANPKNSYINSFHKNHKANLITVCEKCHNKFHENNEQHVRVKTTNGYKISTI